MPLTPIELRPGITKTDTEYGSALRWIDMDKMRFVGGRPEKLGGWTTPQLIPFQGLCRGMLAWRDSTDYRRLAVGTHKKLYRYDSGGIIHDITPFETRAETTLGAAPLATTISSATVTVTHNAHGQQVGDAIVMSGAVAVGGITPNGMYVILSVPTANTYTFNHQLTATATATGGGSAVKVKTFRSAMTNPFSTTSGSTTVTVTHVSHLRLLGDTVWFSNATAVGGITIDGEYTVITIPDPDHYTITHSTPATSTAGPGGGAVTFRYEVSVGRPDSIVARGYGVGGYGRGTYGTLRSTSEITLHARTWSFDTMGEVLIANYRVGDVFEWIPGRSERATPITNAPGQVLSVFVTEERSVVTLGAEGEKMQDWQSERGDREIWAPDDNNDARFDTLNGGSELIAGRRLRSNRAILWSDTGAWLRQYTFDDFIRSFSRIGGRCGIAGPNASAEVAGIVYWMGSDDFFMSDGAGVRPIPCDDIKDYVFRSPGLNYTQRYKFYAKAYQQRGEVWFYWATPDSIEINRYAIYHVNESARAGGSVWSLGTWDRTAGIDRDLFEWPIEAAPNGFLYYHEYGVDANGEAIHAYIRTGGYSVQDGEQELDIDEIWPDFKRIAGTISVTVYTRGYPQSPEEPNGPYLLTSTTDKLDLDPRASGGQVSFLFETNEIGGDMRLGRLRVNALPGGEQ